MNEFFGISMTYIMIALLCVLAVAFACIAYVFFRNRVMFLVGVRNIPRRRAQTVLILIGLMLSTLIISTALSIGDTVEYSVTSTTYDQLGSIDEMVAARTDDTPQNEEDDDEVTDDEPAVALGAIVSPFPIPGDRAEELLGEFRDVDGVDGAIGVVRGPVPVSNVEKGQTEPLALVMGLPDDLTGFEGDLQTTDGDQVAVTDLAEGELYAGDSAADELDIAPGDRLRLFAQGEEHEYVVRDIVNDKLLTGSLLGEVFGFAMPIDAARELFQRDDEVDFIAVSNDGGVREGVKNSEEIADQLNQSLFGTPWAAEPVKKDLVDSASTLASFLTTFFVILGMFSIAAGMLLIFLIFVMLAAERKVEMGMVRAVGTKRSHLVQMFMSEGMVYNVVSAAIGCALGVAVSVVMVGIMARLFAEFGLQVTFHVTPRSLIVAYSIGVVLTFLTVTFSSWRIGNLNIVSAIRDVPDPPVVHQRVPSNSSIGRIVRYVAWVLFKPESWRQFFVAVGIVLLGVVAAVVGYGLFLVAAGIYGDSAVASTLAVLSGVVGGFVIAGSAGLILLGLSQIFQIGPLMLIAGPLLMLQGWESEQAFSFGAGFSLVIIGAALLIRFLGGPARPVFTTMGVVMLVFWLLYAGNNIPLPGGKELEGDIEMFFLSGVTMVIAGTFILVYNADLLLAGLTLLGGAFSTLIPSIKTAVAYPLANKFRTGMTIAMISLVMFALVTFSTINENFDRLFLSDDALAGYDVAATENPGNPIEDLTSALDGAGFDTTGIAGVDKLADANRQIAKVAQLNIEEPDSNGYRILGMSPEFAQNNEFTFSTRATGLDTDEAVRQALVENPDYAVIDAFAVTQDFGPPGVLEGIDPRERVFDPVPLEVRDSSTGSSRTVTLIGVLSTPASGLFEGLFISGEAFEDVFVDPESSIHLVRLNPGVDANQTAKDIERTLLAQGVQADSLRQVVDDYQAQSRGFLYLMQGFMAIGLFVGIAAVGVIAFRTVVERRQQIGMLRAIGYTRRAIALSFLMESSFTALLGIISGIVLALLLAYQLVKTDEFVAGGVPSFYIPWLQILAIAGFAFLASVVMTIIPSRQASSIPIAEALRYE